jgi:hypothetical protein
MIKTKLICLLNGVVWAVILYILAASIGSFVLFYNCFNVALWNEVSRFFLAIFVCLIIAYSFFPEGDFT